MSSFFNAIKNLLTAYHIDKSSTGKIIEPLVNITKRVYYNRCIIMSKDYLMISQLGWLTQKEGDYMNE